MSGWMANIERKDDFMPDTVLALLKKQGIEATYEYPGYFGVGDLSFGTVNGMWGWNDSFGHSGESNISGDETRPDVIAAYIASVANV